MVQLRDTGRRILAVVILMTVFSLVATFLRVLAIFKAKRKIRLHDYLLFGAVAVYIAFCGLVLRAIYNTGGSANALEIGLPGVSIILRWSYIFTPLFTTTITLVKLSILLFYYSIFEVRNFQMANIGVGILCIMWFIAFMVLGFLLCTPIEAYWRLELLFPGAGGRCIPYATFIYAYEISNMLLDFIIIALPLWKIRTLQLTAARKVVIGGIFVLGSFVIIICIIRTIYLSDAQNTNPVALPNGIMWSVIELAVAIICACLPTYGPLLPTERLAKTVESFHVARNGYSRKNISSPQQSKSQYNKIEGGIGSKGDYSSGNRSVTDSRDQGFDAYPLYSINVKRTLEVV